jgi:hypothetical protein
MRKLLLLLFGLLLGSMLLLRTFGSALSTPHQHLLTDFIIALLVANQFGLLYLVLWDRK